jgi:hypothetical protein
MSLFAKRKDLRVQTLILKLVNNNCPELRALLEGPRADSRVNLVVVALVVPLKDGRLQVHRAFAAVTKEFSGSGVGIVVDQPPGFDEAVLGFQFDGEMVYMRGRTKHFDPLGGGFHQLGFQLLEVVSPIDYPQLKPMCL